MNETNSRVRFFIEIEAAGILGTSGLPFAGLAAPSPFSYFSCFHEVYVAPLDDFTITTDQGATGLDPGDTVTWNGRHATITDLTLGENALTSVALGTNHVCESGTVFLAGGTYAEGSEIRPPRSMTLQGDGDYDAVDAFVREYGAVGPQLQADLDRLGQAGIPVDIVYEQGKANLGL